MHDVLWHISAIKEYGSSTAVFFSYAYLVTFSLHDVFKDILQRRLSLKFLMEADSGECSLLVLIVCSAVHTVDHTIL